MIDQWYLIFFNLMFSAFPQLITGTLDKDVSTETLQQLPQLYVSGQNSEVQSSLLFYYKAAQWEHGPGKNKWSVFIEASTDKPSSSETKLTLHHAYHITNKTNDRLYFENITIKWFITVTPWFYLAGI